MHHEYGVGGELMDHINKFWGHNFCINYLILFLLQTACVQVLYIILKLKKLRFVSKMIIMGKL